jgi:sugar phosphate isomerase/epimerase
MKISIRATMRPVRGSDVHPLRWAFEEGSRLGFDGLELCLHANRSSFSTYWTDDLKERTKALCDEFGMSILSVCTDWAGTYSTFFPVYEDWGKAVGFIAEDAKLARELGAGTALMHFASSLGSFEECKALLRDVAAAGEENGVVFGYEANIWARNPALGGLDGLIRMVDEIASPYFGVYLHNSYPRAGLPLHEEVERAGDRLVPAMHSSDLTSGRVDIDWEKAIPALKKYFADGAYTFEVPWDVAEANKKALDEVLARYW